MPVKIYDCFFQLFETHLQYRVEFSATEPIDDSDKQIGDEKVMTSFERIQRKDSITGTDIEYKQKSERNGNPLSYWTVRVFCFAADDISIHFEDQDKARAVFGNVNEWIGAKNYQL